MNKLIKRKSLSGENYHYKLFITPTVLYSIVVCLSIIFLVGMGMSQNLDIYKLRFEPEYKIIHDIDKKDVLDEHTPLGMKKQYRWTLKNIGKDESCLSFYIVHQYAEVYFDGELMYSLKQQDTNKIGKTTASNWIIIPLMPEDEGKEISINIIPVYNEVQNREPTFSIGTKFMIYINQLKKDFPQIILSLVSIVIGIVFVMISIFYRYKGKENINLIYLGIFSFAIGLWKLTDIRSAPLIFTQNTLILSYISIMMTLLSVVPFLLSIKSQFLNKYSHLIEYIIRFYCVLNLFIIFLQITNIADLRQTLWFAHIAIAIIAVITVGIIVYDGKTNKINKSIKILHRCLILCIFAIIIDMSVYYIQGHSSGILYTLMSFLIYVITMGYMYINDINKKANIDIHTGLFNKSRCNELLDENKIIRDTIGIIMFDLNGLKYTNDTFGHESGDILISEFAKIVSKNVSNRDFVGRYGGDEFIVVINEASEYIIKQLDIRILQDVEQYNMKSSKITMSYAMGYALAEDYPGFTLRELFQKADSCMYKNKELHHKERHININYK